MQQYMRKTYCSLLRNLCRRNTYVTEDFVRDRILNDHHRQKIIKRLSNIKNKAKPVKDGGKQAAVLMPLCIVDGQLSLLYTLRSPHLSVHSGQVSFPGGVGDESDASLVETALRETEEELGLCRSKVDVWVSSAAVPDRRNIYSVTPVVGYVGRLEISELNVNKHEVEEVFTVPISSLLKPEYQSYTLFRSGWRMPVIMHLKHKIWGITAIVTDVFLANAFPDIYKLKIHKYQEDITKTFLKS